MAADLNPGDPPLNPGDPTAGDTGWVADAVRWARYWQQSMADTDPPAPSTEHPAECAGGPLCQGLAMLRRLAPDLLQQVSTVTAELAEALRADASRADAGVSVPPPDGVVTRPDGTAASPAPSRVQRIDITD